MGDDMSTTPKKPRRSNTPVETTPAAKVDLTSSAEPSSPAMPNERDEKVGMTGGVPSERVQQGGRDLKRGVQDTSRGPEADKAYQKQKQK
jgi:hypothetical protein